MNNSANKITPLAIQPLCWQKTEPDQTLAMSALSQPTPIQSILDLQPRLAQTLQLFCTPAHHPHQNRFMLHHAPENALQFALLQGAIKQQLPPAALHGFAYQIREQKVIWREASSKQDNFAAIDNCLYAQWFDHEQLFGSVRQPQQGQILLQPGLVHQANGGVLILSLRTLLNQPQQLARLYTMVQNQQFHWLSHDDSQPLPLAIPPTKLDLRIVLLGDRLSLAELQELMPELFESALYSEFEAQLEIQSAEQYQQWAGYLHFLTQTEQLPSLQTAALWPLLKAACLELESQRHLLLDPQWLLQRISEAASFSDQPITAEAMQQALHQKQWREAYLPQKLRQAIYDRTVLINTRDEIIGQVNGLSVLEYPGHPQQIGEPTRLSCLLHFGDGDIIDVERKNELGGNIHAKGMMIMQAFIAAEFALYQQLPFTASLVFEQSYSEVDGDSASLAGLCAIISALAQQSIKQQFAVTGSVDQFGHVQAIGGVNQKIESFFKVCQHQGLTGEQGVIIPASNQEHLSLSDELVQAIKQGQFNIWAVATVAEALQLLTGIPYQGEQTITLHALIQARIQRVLQQEKRNPRWWQRCFKSNQ